MNREQVEKWLQVRGEQDDLLYERFGRPLEREHAGEFVAIADDGRTILGPDDLSVALRALDDFGSRNFALRRVGAPAEISWRAFR